MDGAVTLAGPLGDPAGSRQAIGILAGKRQQRRRQAVSVRTRDQVPKKARALRLAVAGGSCAG
jgi:hypothetical protein